MNAYREGSVVGERGLEVGIEHAGNFGVYVMCVEVEKHTVFISDK